MENPAPGIEGTLRLWPHKLKGEGHYAAVLQKKGKLPEGYQPVCATGTEKGIPAKNLAKDWAEYFAFAKETFSEKLMGEAGLCTAGEGFLAFGDNLYRMPERMPGSRAESAASGTAPGNLEKESFRTGSCAGTGAVPEGCEACMESVRGGSGCLSEGTDFFRGRRERLVSDLRGRHQPGLGKIGRRHHEEPLSQGAAKMRTEILYEDNSILVMQTGRTGGTVRRIGQADVVSELKSYLVKQAGAGQGEPYLAVIHRLDQPVEGVLVFAKEKKSAAVLTKQLSAGTLNKQYYAVLCGYPDASEGELVDYLRKEGSVAVAVTGREKNFPDAKIAKLHYSILEKINQPMPLALADVCIETGRFHQIRAVCPCGWALLGDTKYGNTTVAGTAGSPAYRGVALCAYSLDFTHPGNGKKMSFRVKPQNPAFEKFTKIPSEDIFEG